MSRNPNTPQLDVSMKGGNVSAVYRLDKRSYPMRIARTSNWDRAILRMVHANMRLNGISSLTALDLLVAEFSSLFDKDDPKRGEKFAGYMESLKNKSWDDLGVNVKGDEVK